MNTDEYKQQLKSIAERVDRLITDRPDVLTTFESNIRRLGEKWKAYLAADRMRSYKWLSDNTPGNPLEIYFPDYERFDREGLTRGEGVPPLYLRPVENEADRNERIFVFLAAVHDRELPEQRPIIGKLWSQVKKTFWGDEERDLKTLVYSQLRPDYGDKSAFLRCALDGLETETPTSENVDQDDTPTGDGTDWDRSEHKAKVCKWIQNAYFKSGKANKSKVIRAALKHFGLPADYERRVRTEFDKRRKQ